MNWDHAVSWGREVWVSVSDIARVGQPELRHKTTHIRRDETRNLTPEPSKLIRAPGRSIEDWPFIFGIDFIRNISTKIPLIKYESTQFEFKINTSKTL